MLKGIGATGAPLGPDCPVEMVRRVSPAELVPLVELTRGGHSECLHFGAIAVVDQHGAVLAHAGNPQFVSFTRSTLKVLQALPLLQTGAAKALGLSTRQGAPRRWAMQLLAHPSRCRPSKRPTTCGRC